MDTRFKYPRTMHLPWSDGATSDDRTLSDCDSFAGRMVVVTEKMDGENFTMYRDGFHARSIDNPCHIAYRSKVAAMHSRIACDIPPDMRVCGELCYATHSIRYTELPSYFLGFSVWSGSICLNWDDTIEWISLLGLTPVPVLWTGVFDQAVIRDIGKSVVANGSEGYVVRVADSFERGDFPKCVGKYVRANHVTTDKHWSLGGISYNRLKKDVQNDKT